MIHAVVNVRWESDGVREDFLEEVVWDLSPGRFVEVGRNIEPVPSSRGDGQKCGEEGGGPARESGHLNRDQVALDFKNEV